MIKRSTLAFVEAYFNTKYLAAEADTLQSVTSRGNTTTTGATFGGNIEITKAGGATLRLTNSNQTVVAEDLIGGIEFWNSDLDTPKIGSFIKSVARELYGRTGALTFGVSTTVNTNAVEVMRINEAGYVGIGTTSPQVKLDVSGILASGMGVGSGEIRSYQSVLIPPSDYGNYVSLKTASNKSGIFRSNTDFFVWYNTSTGSTNIDSTLSTQPIIFSNSGLSTELMRILPNGNVGIGTTAPNGKLEVSGNIISSSPGVGSANLQLVSSVGTANIMFNREGYQNWFLGSPNNSTDFGLSEGAVGTYRMYFKSGGNVGIGTTAPNSKLEIQGTVRIQTPATNGYASILSDNSGPIYTGNGDLQFYTNHTAYGTIFYSANKAAPLMTIFDSGNVTLASLAGTGTRFVTASSTGQLGVTTATGLIGDDYIKNQNASAQTANMWISGDALIGSANYLTTITKSNGNLGIGGTTYAQQIKSNGGNTFEIYSETQQPLILGTNSTERVRIDANSGAATFASVVRANSLYVKKPSGYTLALSSGSDGWLYVGDSDAGLLMMADVFLWNKHLYSYTDAVSNIGGVYNRFNNLFLAGLAKANIFESTVAQGTAPLTVASTTMVTNLNSQYLGGYLVGGLAKYVSNVANLHSISNSESALVNAVYQATNLPTSNNYFSGVSVNIDSSHNRLLGFDYEGTLWKQVQNSGTWGSWYKVWDQNTDGAGSGLDADLLDGLHADAFSLAHSHPYLPLAGGSMTGELLMGSQKLTFANAQFIKDNGGGGFQMWSQYGINFEYGTTFTANGDRILSIADIGTTINAIHTHPYLPLAGGTMSNTNLVNSLNAEFLGSMNSSRFTNVIRNTGAVDANIINYAQASDIKVEYRWTNTPSNSIGVLTSKIYSPDWAVQEYDDLVSATTTGNPINKYIRHRYNGTTWSPWAKVWNSSNFTPTVNPINGTGTDDYLTKWNAAGTGLENSLLHESSGSVIVGLLGAGKGFYVNQYDTTNESQLIVSVGNGTTSSKYAYLSIRNADTTGARWDLGTYGDNKIRLVDVVNGNATRLIVDNTGNVGIGTTSPGYSLDVNGNIHTNGAFIVNNAVYGFKNNLGANLIATANNVTYFYSGSSGWQIRDSSDASTLMTISNNGNVGIGTTGPNAKLDVAGDIQVSGVGTTYGNTSKLKLYNSDRDEYWIMNSMAGGARLDFNYNGGSNLFTLDYTGKGIFAGALTVSGTGDSSIAGNVGIGTTTPTEQLSLGGYGAIKMATGNSSGYLTHQYGLNGIDMMSLAANYRRTDYNTGTIPTTAFASAEIRTEAATDYSKIIFGTSPTGNTQPIDRMVIDKSGNVGIGTTNPGVVLEVNKNQNTLTLAGVKNTDAGTSARSGIVVGEDFSQKNFIIQYLNSGWSPNTSQRANGAQIYANALASGGIDIATENASAFITFTTGGLATTNERMRITNAGNVGIGTTSP
ncbi:MAG: beta strand repeat-containing protein, partial [Paludibacter sp.]